MIYDDILRAWIEVIRRIVPGNYEIIRAEGAVGAGAVRPNGPFITVKIISGPVDYTIDEFRRFNARDKMEIVSAKSFTISIQAFREGAMDAILALKLQINNPDNIDYLYNAAFISVTNRGGVTDLSEALETGFDERFQVDFSFAVGLTADTDIGIIETVGDIVKDG